MQGRHDGESEERPSMCLGNGVSGMGRQREDGFLRKVTNYEDSDSSKSIACVSGEMSEGVSETVGSRPAEVVGATTISRELSYSCDRCGIKFGSKREISEHTKVHFGNQVVPCGLHPSGFGHLQQEHDNAVNDGTGRNSRQDSLPGSSEGPISCCVCGETVNSRKDYTGHLVKHCSRRTCIVCSKVFKNTYNLRVHMSLHSGEKPQTCHFCNRPFRLKSTLRHHLQIHTGEKPYTCSICGKSFRHNSTLSRHKDFHLEGKTFECNHCGKLFKWRNSLYAHSCAHRNEGESSRS